MSTEARPACRVCGHRDHWLGDHVAEAHLLSVDDYLTAYPNAPLASASALAQVQRTLPAASALTPPPPVTSLRIPFAGIFATVNHDVPAEACLPLPTAYRIPEYGALADDVKEAAICLHKRRATYISGPQGTGKDAFVHAFSAWTRTPGIMFQVEPAADIRAWFFSREFTKDGTYWKEGELLVALRDGYLTSTGRRVPYIILLTDLDRATKEQIESFRLVLDSIDGRIKGPGGVTYQVLPGTTIVATGNTTGGGDPTGRYVSANVMDASILDRFPRSVIFHAMDWRDEEVIVKAKFPTLVEHCDDLFLQVGKATKALRDATAAETLYAEFSHRALCAWLEAAADIIDVSGGVPDGLLRRAFRMVADKMPDKETNAEAFRVLDAHVKGGVLPGTGAPPASPRPRGRR